MSGPKQTNFFFSMITLFERLEKSQPFSCFLGLVSCWVPQRNQRSNCQHLLDHRKTETVPEKHLLLLNWLCQTVWLCGSQQTGKFLQRWAYQTTWPASWEICMQVRKQQLELDMEQQIISNCKRSASRLYIVTLLI